VSAEEHRAWVRSFGDCPELLVFGGQSFPCRREHFVGAIRRQDDDTARVGEREATRHRGKICVRGGRAEIGRPIRLALGIEP